MSRFRSLLVRWGWLRHILDTRLVVDVSADTVVIETAEESDFPALIQKTALIWHRQSHDVVAIGAEAMSLMGKHGANLELIKPVLHGKVAHSQGLSRLLASSLGEYLRNHQNAWLIRPHLTLAVAPGLSSIERMLWQEAALEAGAQSVELVSRCQAAFAWFKYQKLGQNICAVEIQHDTVTVACFVQAQLVFETNLAAGLYQLQDTITALLREQFQASVSSQEVAKLLKGVLGGAVTRNISTSDHSASPARRSTLRAKDIISGLPTTIKVEEAVIHKVVQNWAQHLAKTVAETLQQLDTGVVTDLLEQGLVMYGSAANVAPLKEALANQCHCQVIVADQPEKVVSKGLKLLSV